MLQSLGNPRLEQITQQSAKPDGSRSCIFKTWHAKTLTAAEVIQASIRCTALSRHLNTHHAGGCQPLGAWHCALGFQACLPAIQGSDACLAHFNRFLEQQGCFFQSGSPPSTVAPVDANAQYRIEAVFSTCLDRKPSDCQASPQIVQPLEHLALAQTPSFVGHQGHGWDAMFEAILAALPPQSPEASAQANDHHPLLRVNLVLGFEHFPENYRVMETLFEPFGVQLQILSDARGLLNATSAPRISPQGTSLETLRRAPTAADTLVLRPWQLPRTRSHLQHHWDHANGALPIPMGLYATDLWLEHMAKLSAKEIPSSLMQQRSELIATMQQAAPLLVGQRIAVYGEPDFVVGISRFLMELGLTPALIVCQNGGHCWHDALRAMFETRQTADSPLDIDQTATTAEPEVPIITGTTLDDVGHRLESIQPDLLIAPPDHRLEADSPASSSRPMRRVDLACTTPDQPDPSTLAYQGARHLLRRILASVASAAND